MACKATLRGNTNSVQRLLLGLSGTLRDQLRCLVHPPLHLLLVLQLGELAGEQTQNDVLALGEVLERLKATSTGSVVFQVVGVNVQLVKQLSGNVIVSTLGEVSASDEVSSAEVDTNVVIRGALREAVVVKLDIGVKESVGVFAVVLETLQHLLGAEVGKVGVIDLDVAAAVLVKNSKLLTVCLRDVCEVFGVVGVHGLGVCPAGLVSEVVPLWCRKSELGLMLSLLGKEVLQVVPLVDVCASNVLDLSCADDCLSGLVSALSEGCNVWDVHAEDVNVWVLNLFKSLQSGEEGTPKRLLFMCPFQKGEKKLFSTPQLTRTYGV